MAYENHAFHLQHIPYAVPDFSVLDQDGEVQHFEDLYLLPEACFVLDRDWRFTFVNAEAERMLNKTRDALLGNGLWEVYPELAGTVPEEQYRLAWAEQKPVHWQQYDTARGRWYELQLYPDAEGLAVYCHDPAQPQQKTWSIETSAISTRYLLWHATVWHRGNKILHWNTYVINEEAAQQFLPLDIAPGEHYALAWDRARLPDDRTRIRISSREALWSDLSGYSQDFRVRRKDGAIRWLHEEAHIEKLAPGIWKIVGVCTDNTEQMLFEEQLQEANRLLEKQKAELAELNARLLEIAATDNLTGLKNQRAFQERLSQEVNMGARYYVPLSLMMVDVDHFKSYNDSFGHVEGDQVLREVASILQTTVRITDFVARYGGEEFVILMPQTDATMAMFVAERVRTAILDYSWLLRAITVSIGVASLEHDLDDAAQLLEKADNAMYRSKEKGRNRVTHFYAS